MKNLKERDLKFEEQRETLANIKRFFNVREDVIQLFTTIASVARFQAIKEEGIKILTSKLF